MSRNGTSQAKVSRPGPGPDVIVFGQIARDLVLDTTGAGDVFMAGLITALAQNGGPQRAARLAAAVAGATVGHPGGGRP